jgi:glycosyltransferase involved in cell wall biosynthesis
MKIAYVAQWDVSQESGVLKKIAAQMQAWIASGHQARLFALSRSEHVSAVLQGLAVEPIACQRIRQCFVQAGALTQRVLAWQPDVVYLRFYMYYPALGKLMRAIPTYLEINADDVKEFRYNHPRHIYLYHRATRARLLRQARGIVCVSHEVAASLRAYQKPLIVIGNGIDLSRYPVYPVPANPEPVLVYLGDGHQPWQGIDKILSLARHVPAWTFHVIGDMPSPISAEAPSNVHLYGHLSREHYDPLLRQADAALGALALYRKQMHENSTLKVLEYLARGIPTIIGYQETNFAEPVPFLLQVPNTPDDPGTYVPDIVRFVNAWKGQRVPRTHIEHIDVRVKERQRLAFLSGRMEQDHR